MALQAYICENLRLTANMIFSFDTCLSVMLTIVSYNDSYLTLGVHTVIAYLKGIYNAFLGRDKVYSYDCRPSQEVNLDNFSDRIARDYSEALEILAE